MAIDVDKLKALAEVKRVVEVFDPKKKNRRTWFSQFRDKVKAGNLNVDEYKLLLGMHFVDTDLVQQWDEKRGTCSTVDKVDAWFLDAYGGGGMEEKHAVYTMADVKLSVADAFQPFVDRFIDTFMAANPNAIRNHRITPFINALYPEMREALEIEPAFSEWNDLVKRTEHLHAKLQKKARAKLAAVQSTQSVSDLERWEKLTDRLERVEASIAALHTCGRGRGNSMPRGGRGGYAVYGNRPSPQVAYGFTPGRNAGSGWRGGYRG
uniref:Uncharacterized protein n=1 Tax=Chromera velia CCMP2878 TaxID=1169474 RepID=A0A0G4H9X3_9ALVE|eukprot:Cvel_894.t1-p1 / transcript=Cvel_894.t1 / gene=Cvel_894 / organism=Chromera_velia_CCMP2878 / gene_product=hypothetical protein / transcript_product=hypothetical protein / location=Cvel_scaffold28:72646-73437(-) / protein_length=264 / sequence_SO=supercontig / SO=protein_coding / is_pseudo=false